MKTSALLTATAAALASAQSSSIFDSIPNCATFRLTVPSSGPSELIGKNLTKITTPISGSNATSTYLGFLNDGKAEDEFRGLIRPAEGTGAGLGSGVGGEELDFNRGEVVDAEVEAWTPVWLRPTHGTPFYFVRYGGNPLEDAVPALVQYKDWRIEEVVEEEEDDGGEMYGEVKKRETGRFVLAYGEAPEDGSDRRPQWVACGNGEKEGVWSLYYSGTREGCTEEFELEVVYE